MSSKTVQTYNKTKFIVKIGDNSHTHYVTGGANKFTLNLWNFFSSPTKFTTADANDDAKLTKWNNVIAGRSAHDQIYIQGDTLVFKFHNDAEFREFKDGVCEILTNDATTNHHATRTPTNSKSSKIGAKIGGKKRGKKSRRNTFKPMKI